MSKNHEQTMEMLSKIMERVNLLDSKVDKMVKSGKKAIKEAQGETKKRHGKSAFNLFGDEMRPKLKEQGIEAKQMFTELGKLWRELGQDEKQRFVDAAAKQKEDTVGETQVKEVVEQQIAVNENDDDVAKIVKGKRAKKTVQAEPEKKPADEPEKEEKKTIRKKSVKIESDTEHKDQEEKKIVKKKGSKNESESEEETEKPVIKKGPVRRHVSKPNFNDDD